MEVTDGMVWGSVALPETDAHAHAALDRLAVVFGEHEPEVVRLRTLLHFLVE